MPCSTRAAIAFSTAGGGRKSLSATQRGMTSRPAYLSQRVLQVPARSTKRSKSNSTVPLFLGVRALVLLEARSRILLGFFLLLRTCFERVFFQPVLAVVDLFGADGLLLGSEGLG